jgi:hypothetical protein
MILPGRATRQAELQTFEWAAPRGGRTLRNIAERLQIAIARRQHRAEIDRQLCVHGLQVDDLIALDHAEPQSAIRFKPDDLHERFLVYCSRAIKHRLPVMATVCSSRARNRGVRSGNGRGA